MDNYDDSILFSKGKIQYILNFKELINRDIIFSDNIITCDKKTHLLLLEKHPKSKPLNPPTTKRLDPSLSSALS